MTDCDPVRPRAGQIDDTMVDVLRRRAADEPDRVGFTFVGPRESDGQALTYRELDLRARATAQSLTAIVPEGARVLLLYRPGLDYVAAFYGCLYAGVIAVPGYPPRSDRPLTRLVAVARDAGATVALTTSRLLPGLRKQAAEVPELSSLRWMVTDDRDAPTPGWDPPAVVASHTAFLQYTSGSTATPKGVVVSHHNLMANSESMRVTFDCGPDTHGFSWLPPYHDMGLIGGLIQPLYTGFPITLMSPLAFLQRPLGWLTAMSDGKCTMSGGPNFGYDHCVRRIPPSQRDGLDLSSWKVAINGAEPVRQATLQRFTEAFAPYGFDPSAFAPSYGLAEATLLVSARRPGSGFTSIAVDREALQHGRVVPADPDASTTRIIVGSGAPVDDTAVCVLQPDGVTPCRDGEVGEICVSGPGVTAGYWGRAGGADIGRGDSSVGERGEPILRTEDLGLLSDGELFVTGRLRDTIVIRGRNHYAEDIEATVESCHEGVLGGAVAAFAIEGDDKAEHLVVVQEVRRGSKGLDLDEVARAIQAAVADAHGVEVSTLALVAPKAVPKTSSGKTQRWLCRERFLAGTLEPLLTRTRPATTSTVKVDEPRPSNGGSAASGGQRTRLAVEQAARRRVSRGLADELRMWLVDYAENRINSALIDERRTIPPHIVLDFGNQGLLGMEVPDSHGGIGLQTRDMVRVLEQLGAIDLTLALFVGNNNALGVRPILKFGAPQERDDLLPSLARGRQLAAFALTEPGAGSNPRGITTRADPDGSGGWLITGSKSWIGSAAWAGVVNVFAQVTPDDEGHGGITGFAIGQGTRGLRPGAEALTMGMRGMVQNAVHLDRVPVGRSKLLGEVGHGLEVAQDAMLTGRLGLGAVGLGGMKRCAQLMARYADRRRVSTGRLLDNPVTLARLSDLIASIDALEALVGRTAELIDLGQPVPAELYVVCKVAGTEMLWQAADRLMQLLGGRGYIETNVAARLLRDARVFRVFEGPTETLAMFVGASAINQSRELDLLLEQTFGCPSVARRLRDAVMAISERSKREQLFEAPGAGYQWACHQAGLVTTSAVMLAVTRSELERRPSEELRRAVAWAESRFDDAVARGDDVVATKRTLLSASAAALAATRFRDDIGDIDQIASGEDRELDEYLRRDPRPDFAPSSPPTAPPEADRTPAPGARAKGRSGTGPHGQVRTAQTIADWISDWLVQRIDLPPDIIDPDQPLAALGLDSIVAVEIAADLQDWLGQPVDATLAWDFPTIKALAARLAHP